MDQQTRKALEAAAEFAEPPWSQLPHPIPLTSSSSHDILQSEREKEAGKLTPLTSVDLIPTAGIQDKIPQEKSFHQAHEPK